MQPNVVLLSTSYFPPIQYFAKIIQYEHVVIEQHEFFQKQTYRNRCHILSANGLLPLTVPIVHTGNKIQIRDVKIDYRTRWRNIHMRAIESAYRSAPFYIYYADDIFSVLHKNYTFLFDLNHAILEMLFSNLQLNKIITYTAGFKQVADNFVDFSDAFHPKPHKNTLDESFQPFPYYQVFQHKFGFIKNLSILDLLFNAGPETVQELQKSIIYLKSDN